MRMVKVSATALKVDDVVMLPSVIGTDGLFSYVVAGVTVSKPTVGLTTVDLLNYEDGKPAGGRYISSKGAKVWRLDGVR